MAIYRTWTSDTYIEATSSTFTTLSGTTEEFSSTVDLGTNGYDLIYLWPEIDFDVTPTDDVTINVYSSHDGGTNWDDIPIYSITVDSGTDPSLLAIKIQNPPPTIRVGFVQTGTTDSHDVRCSYKASRWDNA